MMDSIQIIVLSLVQGLTEFLPISSSAHLIFVPKLFGWEDQGLAFDVAVHLGTLLAVILYFHQDLSQMIKEFCQSLYTRKITPYAKLMWFLGFATIPAGISGILFKETIETSLRSPLVIATTTVFFALIMLLADKLGEGDKNVQKVSWKDAMLIGCGQAIALIPGTSRAGITLTAGLALGLTREAAARFSFLLSVPVIALAGIYESYSLFKSNIAVDWRSLSLGLIISAITGFLCIHLFLKILQKIGVMPFVIYRILLGLMLVLVFVV